MAMKETSNWQPQSLDRWDWLFGAAVLIGTFAVLMSTLDIGITRDESFYFRAAHDYIGWFEDLWKHAQAGELSKSFTQDNVDKHWSYNAEHPVLVKTLFALSHKLFHDTLGWLGHIPALRLPGAAFGALTCLLTYLFGRELFGRVAGLVAAGALFLQPRFFFHAHLTCFDVPVTALWVAVIYAYWKSLDSRRWAIATGLLWGLALSAKLNAFFLPAVMGLHWLLTHWRQFGIAEIDGSRRLVLPRIPRAFLWMAILGPILFYALWPRHWFDTTERILWYLDFHLRHVHYFVYYMGENWIRPPFPVSFPWVMTAITVPASILIASLVGVFRAAREFRFGAWLARWKQALTQRELPDEPAWDRRGTALLLTINFIFPIALIGMPETPIFGGTKHWMPAMPFMAIVAGAGVLWGIEGLRGLASRADHSAEDERPDAHGWLTVLGAVILSAAVLGPAGYATAHNHPWGTGYYNEFIGGHRGAAEVGMMRQFWGYAGRAAIPFLNEHAQDGTRVWISNTTGGAWASYRRDDLIEKNLRTGWIVSSDVALFHHQEAFAKQKNKVFHHYDTMAPSRIYGVDGVPMLTVYLDPDSEIYRDVHGPDDAAEETDASDRPKTDSGAPAEKIELKNLAPGKNLAPLPNPGQLGNPRKARGSEPPRDEVEDAGD